jgi:hypothetical protein
MDGQHELIEAQRLLWELHRLGGPSPEHMSPEEVLHRYRQLLAEEGARDTTAGTLRGEQPDPPAAPGAPPPPL